MPTRVKRTPKKSNLTRSGKRTERRRRRRETIKVPIDFPIKTWSAIARRINALNPVKQDIFIKVIQRSIHLRRHRTRRQFNFPWRLHIHLDNYALHGAKSLIKILLFCLIWALLTILSLLSLLNSYVSK